MKNTRPVSKIEFWRVKLGNNVHFSKSSLQFSTWIENDQALTLESKYVFLKRHGSFWRKTWHLWIDFAHLIWPEIERTGMGYEYNDVEKTKKQSSPGQG